MAGRGHDGRGGAGGEAGRGKAAAPGRPAHGGVAQPLQETSVSFSN